uniref:hypothetical protein n=1 Tax=Nonomuraea sp. CA-251285 TaxID=3240002 RepID=UPI003F491D0F
MIPDVDPGAVTVVVGAEQRLLVTVDDGLRVGTVAAGVLAELAVITPGVQGPPGPAGPPGGAFYVYDRAGVPAATWTIAHGLGRRVHVSITGDDGREVDADVDHPDPNTTVIVFGVPFSGTALIG